MAAWAEFFSGNHGKLQEVLRKITAYQKSLPDGRAVELDELKREGVLSSADIEFMSTNSVTYKPHRVSDYHSMDMLHMPTERGSLFTGPAGRSPSRRRARLADFQPIVLNFLKIPRPKDELLLHVEFSERDGMGISPGFVSLTLRSKERRLRLDSLRSVAEEFGISKHQDNEIQGNHILSFRVSADADHTAAVAVAFLVRGCQIPLETDLVYSAGALDEA